MCVSGAWTESYQVRRFFGVRTIGSAVFLFWLAGRSRAKLPLPEWAIPAGTDQRALTVGDCPSIAE
jgi:hypothetical protein